MLRITSVLLISVCFGNGQLVSPEVMDKIHDMFPFCRIGEDYSGAGVYYAPYGAWKFAELAAYGTPEERQAFEMLPDEMVHEFADDRGRNGEGALFIADHSGVDMAELLSPNALQMSSIFFRLHREASRASIRIMVINSGMVAQMFLLVWNPLLGDLGRTTQVYGSNPDEYVPQLLLTVPPSVLLQGIGGSNPKPQECNRVESLRPYNSPNEDIVRSAMSFISQNPVQLVSNGVSAFNRAIGDASSAFGGFFG